MRWAALLNSWVSCASIFDWGFVSTVAMNRLRRDGRELPGIIAGLQCRTHTIWELLQSGNEISQHLFADFATTGRSITRFAGKES